MGNGVQSCELNLTVPAQGRGIQRHHLQHNRNRQGKQLDPYRYLTWLMHKAPKLDMEAEEQVAGLMPGNAPVECRDKRGV